MDDLSQFKSLERYVLTRGRHLVSPSAGAKGLKIQLGIGIGLMVIGAALALASVLSGIHGLAIGAIGPTLAGVVNTLVAIGLRRAFGRPQVQAPELSREARTMMSRLSWAYIWSKNPWAWGMPGFDASWQWSAPEGAHNTAYSWKPPHQKNLSEIPGDVLHQMDQAASHFNRISGALEAAATTGATQRMRPKIAQAADEAMLDVLHQAQLASQFPEGMKSIQGRLTADLATLSELGDRVEALALREPTFTDMIARRTTADEVLEELRLEQSAFTELSFQPDDGPKDHLQA